MTEKFCHHPQISKKHLLSICTKGNGVTVPSRVAKLTNALINPCLHSISQPRF